MLLVSYHFNAMLFHIAQLVKLAILIMHAYSVRRHKHKVISYRLI